MISDRFAPKNVYRAVIPRIGAASGLFMLMRRTQKSSALVLMYHGVLDTSRGETLVNANQVDARTFRWQMEFLRKRYTLVPLSEVIRRVKVGKPVEGLAAVTFDDGYASVKENAVPVLRELAIPATIFLIAGLTGSGELTWYDTVETRVRQARGDEITVGGQSFKLGSDRSGAVSVVKRFLRTLPLDERDRAIAELAAKTGELDGKISAPFRLMGWDEVLSMRSALIDFGVHTYSHPHLTKAMSALGREVDEATRLVTERLNTPAADLIFCYPDGDYNAEIRNHVEAAGLLGAVAVQDRLAPPNADPFALPRVAVARDYSRSVFQDATVGFTRALKGLI